MPRSFDSADDPFAAMLAPPPDESPQQRAEREAREAEAKRINDEIDEALRQEKAAARRKKAPVKVLLLGQSESGKSTTLKNFQLTYARKTWQEERICWRPVVQLNLVRSITLLLDLLAQELAAPPLGSDHDPHQAISPATSDESDEDDHEADYERHGRSGSGTYYPPSSAGAGAGAGAGSRPTHGHGHTHSTSLSTSRALLSSKSTIVSAVGLSNKSKGKNPEVFSFKFTDKHRFLQVRLGPLRSVQRDLQKVLGAGSEEPVPAGPTFVAAFEYAAPLKPSSSPISTSTTTTTRPSQEFFVRSNNGWRGALEKIIPLSSGPTGTGRSPTSQYDPLKKSVDDTTAIIAGCREDMTVLWNDHVVRNILKKHGRRLEDEAGFFLDDIDRIARPDYMPSDDDIIRARLRTMGVQEHKFIFDGKGIDVAHEWIMYDVGGTRTLRQAWAPYFTDINAIIFLAPISCFDQKLAEDPSINRLEDSFILWKIVCSNPLLAKTQLVLFMNKCDVLERKLSNGTMIRRWVTSFGDRPNESAVVIKYLKGKFRDIAKQNSPVPRPCYIHPTSVVDTKATAVTLSAVREGILREHLRNADFL